MISKLRTKVCKALGHGLAGAQPAVRLTLLSSNPLLDPGLYCLWTTFQDFRRLTSKQPYLLSLWQDFMVHFSGQLHPGPFSVLLNQLELLSWHLHDPPFVSDHTGHEFDFLGLAEDQLWTKTVHGWHLRLSRTLARRKDIDGLLGLDWRPTQLALQRLPPLALASMQALVEGSFMTGRSQAKFDLTKDGSCSFCSGPDTIEHWCLHCPRLQPVLHRHADIRRRWHALPSCMTEHLLCPANPFHQQLLHQLWIQPQTALHAHPSALPSHLNFFTDGSCYQPHHPMLALAGWAASLAFTNFDLAGPLIGHPQTISRAELTAVLQVLRWSNVHAIASPISMLCFTVWNLTIPEPIVTFGPILRTPCRFMRRRFRYSMLRRMEIRRSASTRYRTGSSITTTVSTFWLSRQPGNAICSFCRATRSTISMTFKFVRTLRHLFPCMWTLHRHAHSCWPPHWSWTPSLRLNRLRSV